MKKDVVLVIGANGQLGSVLTETLKDKHGPGNVIASDIRKENTVSGHFEIVDATDIKAIQVVIEKYSVTQIYHLAAILSAKGEEKPLFTWDLNMRSWLNVLEASRVTEIEKVFFPSSIAVFGESTNKEHASQNSYLDPTTVYGISKVAGENWAKYYFSKYNLDVRSLRFPGIIGYQSMPGGGTTDYAVDIYHKAVQSQKFECFLAPDTTLPMIFIDDAIRAVIELMGTPKDNIKVRTSYNISGASFSPSEIAVSIQKEYPEFEINYQPDFRQQIADSWPKKIDDSAAAKDWNWQPRYNLNDITHTMISKLKEKYKVRSLI